MKNLQTLLQHIICTMMKKVSILTLKPILTEWRLLTKLP